MSVDDVHESDHSGEQGRRSPALILLVVLLAIECVVVSAAAVYLLVELLVDTPLSYPSAIAMLVLAVIAALGVGFTTVKLLAGQQWTRSAVVVWQVLQAAVGMGSLQGDFARPEIGWPLVILAVLVLVLLFTKSVMAATTQRY